MVLMLQLLSEDKFYLYYVGKLFTVYMSGAVLIEHKGTAKVFYCEQKPQVCTVDQVPPSYQWFVQRYLGST